jgi:membrane protease YdiL (CAAX protease family)
MSVPPPALPPVRPGPPPELPELPAGIDAPRAAPVWPWWNGPVALLTALAVVLLVGGVLAFAITSAAGAGEPPAGVKIGGTYFLDLVLVLSALGFARLTASPRPWHFGLRGTPRWSTLGLGFATWVAFLVVLLGFGKLFGTPDQENLPEELGIDSSVAALIAVTVLVTVVAPITEELFFRGFFFTALRSWRGVWPAAILTGLVFGLIHAGSAEPVFLIPLALFGFALCLLYWRTGSLYPCMSAHALNNSFALGVTEEWMWWQVIGVVVLAHLAIAAIVVPLGRRAPMLARAAPARA